MTGSRVTPKAVAPAMVSKGNNEHSHLGVTAFCPVQAGVPWESGVAACEPCTGGDQQHVPRAQTRQIQGRSGDIASPHSNKEFARIPLQVLRAAALWHSPWNHKVMAWKGIGRACRKVQPLMFKRGMVQFDSLLWARSFRALVPRTPVGFSLPAEAFLGSSLWSPACPVPGGSGLPSESTPASEKARK